MPDECMLWHGDDDMTVTKLAARHPTIQNHSPSRGSKSTTLAGHATSQSHSVSPLPVKAPRERHVGLTIPVHFPPTPRPPHSSYPPHPHLPLSSCTPNNHGPLESGSLER